MVAYPPHGVCVHLWRRVKEVKCRIAHEKLTALVPTIGKLTRQIALEETHFNVDKALELMRAFQVAHADTLDKLQQRRLRAIAERRNRSATVSKDIVKPCVTTSSQF